MRSPHQFCWRFLAFNIHIVIRQWLPIVRFMRLCKIAVLYAVHRGWKYERRSARHFGQRFYKLGLVRYRRSSRPAGLDQPILNEFLRAKRSSWLFSRLLDVMRKVVSRTFCVVVVCFVSCVQLWLVFDTQARRLLGYLD